MLPSKLIVVADSAVASPHPLTWVLEEAVRGGARTMLLREKHLSSGPRSALATWVAWLLADVNGTLLIGSDDDRSSDDEPGQSEALAERISDEISDVTVGLHLSAMAVMPVRRPALIGRSCHDEQSVSEAAEEGVDYVTLSPVFNSPSKPGYGPALGLNMMSAMQPPVWALGGVNTANAGECIRSGAHGVAVMSGVMTASDPAEQVETLLKALS